MKTSHIAMYIAIGVFIYLFVFWCFGFDSKCASRWEKWTGTEEKVNSPRQ